MNNNNVTIDLADAVELAEMLEFIYEFFGYAPDVLTEQLETFTSSAAAYGLDDLRLDLGRFMLLFAWGVADVKESDWR